ncbi:MAG: LCP family protein [Actinobacteria bacterium]|nr:LCP family protein [Actinomycetota bacterium]
MSEPNEPRPSSGHGRIVRLFLAIAASLSLIVGVVGGISFASYQAVQDVGAKPHFYDPDPSASPGADQPTGPCVDSVCNYLILGSDSRAGLTPQEQAQFGTDADIGGSNRADTIMVVHSDPRAQKATILSFPRDLWVDIPGVGEDKINAAFEGGVNGGGPELVAKTVHEITGLRINHFVYVDLAGFQGIVDTLGGVEMCIPGENVNTPGSVAGPNGNVYYEERGFIVDPYTGLHVRPGCQRLAGDQALAYVRTRHLRCDSVPDFARINRQQEFLHAVINRLLQPSELLKAPSLVRPVLANLKRDAELTPADLVFLVGQLRGMSTGAAEFRSVPGTPGFEQPSWSSIPLSVVHMDRSAEQLFEALRDGTPLPGVGTQLGGVAPSAATIAVPVIDHASGDGAAQVEQVLSDAGFDIAPGIVDFDTAGVAVKGSVIAYEPGHDLEAQVVGSYFPDLRLQETEKGALPGADVAVFVTADHVPQEPGSGPSSTTCIVP